jgi:hypothetical protein
MSKRYRLVVLFVAAYIVGTVVAQRRGYRFGTNSPVRCRSGHVFSTIWIPGASIKSLRLGWWRLQWCPVGRHWTVVTPVKEAELTSDELESLDSYHDVRIP